MPGPPGDLDPRSSETRSETGGERAGDAAPPLAKLAHVEMTSLAIEYEQSTDGSREVCVSLVSLQVCDVGREGRPLVSSSARPSLVSSAPAGAEVARTEEDKEEKLVHVRYRSAEGVAAEVHLRFNHVHVEWIPSSVSALLAFVRDEEASSPISREPPPTVVENSLTLPLEELSIESQAGHPVAMGGGVPERAPEKVPERVPNRASAPNGASPQPRALRPLARSRCSQSCTR